MTDTPALGMPDGMFGTCTLTLEEMEAKARRIVAQACIEQYGDTLGEDEDINAIDLPCLTDLDYGWTFIEEVVRAMSPIALPQLLKLWARYHDEDRRTPEELADAEEGERFFERVVAAREQTLATKQ